MSEFRSLIRRGRDLDRNIKAQSEELRGIKEKLIAAGAGDHAGTDGAMAKVTLPGPTLKPSVQAVETVRARLGSLYFARVFTPTVVHKPVKGFREIITALLGAAPAAELIAACEEPSAPQVRFS